MSAVVASPSLLRVRGNQAAAHMTMPSDPHARLALEHQVLSARLAGSLQDDLLRVVVAGDDGGVLFVPPDNGFPSRPVGVPLGIGALDGIPGAVLAPLVLAAGALVAGAEGGMAPVTFPVDSHAN